MSQQANLYALTEAELKQLRDNYPLLQRIIDILEAEIVIIDDGITVDDRSPFLDLLLPHLSNRLDKDLPRLRESLQMLDSFAKNINKALVTEKDQWAATMERLQATLVDLKVYDEEVQAKLEAQKKEIHKGISAWQADIDYAAPSLVFGTDDRLYRAITPSGPGNGGAQPVTDGNFWTVINHSSLPQFTSQTLIAEYATAGEYTWTVPNLNNGKPYKLFVVVKGAGGGGGLGWRTADNYVHAANGGGEGATLFVWLDTSKPGHPKIGEQIQIIVGAGGAAATAHGNGRGGEASSFITASGGTWGALGGGGGTAGYQDGGFGALSDLPLSFGGTWMMLGGHSSDHPVVSYAAYPHARRGGGRGGAATGVAGCGGTGGQYDDYFNIPARAGGDGYIRIFMMGE